MPRTTKRSARRAGFTMIEMLVVVTIIAILLSLTTAAVLKLIPAQQSFNTKTALTRFDSDLQRAYRAAADKFRHEPIPNQGSVMGNVYYNNILPMTATAAQPNGDRARAQVIWTKLRLKQTLPNNFSEALNPAPLPALSYYQTKLNALGYFGPSQAGYNTLTPSPNPTLPWESSVCLLWALQRGEDGPALKESDFGTGSLKDFGPTPNNQTVKGLIDDWGMPLAFCRWPVNSTQVNPGGAQPGDKNDSDDPSGLLEATNWEMSGASLSANAVQFVNWCHPLALHPANTKAQTFRIYPLIVSAGPDKVLGLDPTNFFATLPPTNKGSAADNLYPALASPK
jgi:prepilin-type N-terminal cleavage/methylation domain-containing protein